MSNRAKDTPEYFSDQLENGPLELVNALGAAAILGVTRQRVSQMISEKSDRVPLPIGYLNNNTHRPIWLRSQFASDK
jgi:hypothetical protein